MSLMEAILAEAEAQRDRPLFDAVILGLSPFKLGTIEMFIDYRIDTMEDYLVVVVQGLEDVFEEPIGRPLLLNQDDFYRVMSEKLLQFYRNRPRIEPEDHIVLGEE